MGRAEAARGAEHLWSTGGDGLGRRRKEMGLKSSQSRSPKCAVGCESGDQAGQSAWRRALPPQREQVSDMTYARGATRVATAVLLLVAVTACADDGNDPATNPSASPSSSAPTTSTPTPPTDSELASEAASVVLRRFYDVRNQLRQDPSLPLDRLDEVAISTELAAQKNLFKKERKQGLHQTGETKVAKLDVKSVNLDNSDPKVGRVPTVQIDLCFDVSGVDVIDKNGKSVVSPDRPDTGWIRFLVSNYQWDKDPEDGWRVASSQDIERTPCDAS